MSEHLTETNGPTEPVPPVPAPPGEPVPPAEPAEGFAAQPLAPGTTALPEDDPTRRNVDDVAEENARLRSDLDAENARLRQALADSRAGNADAQGLTHEDVRRVEHPEEFDAEGNPIAHPIETA